jgi:hypothetical protein
MLSPFAPLRVNSAKHSRSCSVRLAAAGELLTRRGGFVVSVN